jgi:hypothetical protein
MEVAPDGHEDNFPEWCYRRGSVYRETLRI